MFRVTLELGGKRIRAQTFEKSLVTIGRDPTCDVVVDNIGCSRRHALIERTEEGYVLADLKSHNGTYVEGERIYHHRLRPHDQFLIAKLCLRFQDLDEDRSEPNTDPVFPEQPEGQTFHLDPHDVQRLVALSSRAGTSAQLVQLAPDPERRTIDLTPPHAVVGALPASDVRLRGLLAPARAAVLVHTADGWRALGTTRRFRVNGKSAWDVRLEDGDLLTCGRTRLRFSQA